MKAIEEHERAWGAQILEVLFKFLERSALLSLLSHAAKSTSGFQGGFIQTVCAGMGLALLVWTYSLGSTITANVGFGKSKSQPRVLRLSVAIVAGFVAIYLAVMVHSIIGTFLGSRL